MCAILDANVVHEVFSDRRPPAGIGFYNWINSSKGGLLAGGKNLDELNRGSSKFKQWAVEAVRQGRLQIEPPEAMEEEIRAVQRVGDLRSNDVHVIALARVSHVRLLYSNDAKLQEDFDDKILIDRPRGKVYSTTENSEFDRGKQKLLARKRLCRRTH